MRTHGLLCHDPPPFDCESVRKSGRSARHGTTAVPSAMPDATMKDRGPALSNMDTPSSDQATDRGPIAMSSSSPRIRRRFYRPVPAALLFVLAALLPQLAQAARVTFDNCLPTNYKDHEPKRLQFEPLYVDAVFDTENESHGLRVTAWGNVAGGEIEREPGPRTDNPKATTLVRRVNVLTYEPYRSLADFCQDALENAKCPLGPVPDTMGM